MTAATLLTASGTAAAQDLPLPDSAVFTLPPLTLNTGAPMETDSLWSYSRLTATPDTTLSMMSTREFSAPPALLSLYELPYSRHTRQNNWKGLWTNTAVLSGAFISTLLVLECLPEEATAWNRAEIQSVPMFKRWFRNIFKRGPEWDHDNVVFNYFLHPYAGAVYFMAARTQGFSFGQSMLYSACISTIGWEFGIEAFMERPSYQDLVITPVVGSIIGEGFYRIKRHIVSHDYRLAGSPVLGNIVAFLVDPVNEVVDLFRGNKERRLHLGRKEDPGAPHRQDHSVQSSLMPSLVNGAPGFSFTCTF